jgi:hypothetical protein
MGRTKMNIAFCLGFAVANKCAAPISGAKLARIQPKIKRRTTLVPHHKCTKLKDADEF